MNQKVVKRLKKFCLLFDLDFEQAKDVFNQMSDKEKDHEMREMKFEGKERMQPAIENLESKIRAFIRHELSKKEE